MAGRKPLPTQLKLVKGTARPHRMNPDEPQPAVATPPPPEHLDEPTAAKFTEMAQLLARHGVMTELEEAGHWIYWMGMPIVRSETFRPRVELLNEIYETEAADHPRVTFVESWSVFQGPDGGYSEYLTDANGDLVDMRLDDGVHLTAAGHQRLAGPFAAQLEALELGPTG